MLSYVKPWRMFGMVVPGHWDVRTDSGRRAHLSQAKDGALALEDGDRLNVNQLTEASQRIKSMGAHEGARSF